MAALELNVRNEYEETRKSRKKRKTRKKAKQSSYFSRPPIILFTYVYKNCQMSHRRDQKRVRVLVAKKHVEEERKEVAVEVALKHLDNGNEGDQWKRKNST